MQRDLQLKDVLVQYINDLRYLTRLKCLQLPLPYLKAGYLTAPPAGKSLAPHSDWRKSQFVLNHEGLQQVNIFFYQCFKFSPVFHPSRPIVTVESSVTNTN